MTEWKFCPGNSSNALCLAHFLLLRISSHPPFLYLWHTHSPRSSLSIPFLWKSFQTISSSLRLVSPQFLSISFIHSVNNILSHILRFFKNGNIYQTKMQISLWLNNSLFMKVLLKPWHKHICTKMFTAVL